MKIAIYEPESMLGGLQTWAHHLRLGLRALGHDADWVTFTRSGKPRSAWELKPDSFSLKRRLWPYDYVVKYTDAVEFLSGYDGVILNDPRSFIQDATAQRGLATLSPSVPDYVTILSRLQIPVTVAVHCSRYPAKQFPYLDELLNAITTGSLVVHSQQAFNYLADCMTQWNRFTTVEVPLPYEAANPVGSLKVNLDSTSTDTVVGLVGRYTAVKGHRALAATWAHEESKSGLAVELWGGCDSFRGPAASQVTYDTLVGAADISWIEDGSPSTSRQWALKRDEPRTTLRYNGGYTNNPNVFGFLDISVNLTTTDASGGALEYAQLESIDAGCEQIAVTHRWDDRYVGTTIEWVGAWPSDPRFAARGSTAVKATNLIAKAIEQALKPPTDLAERRAHNREVLHRLHDPATIASAYVDVLTSRS